MPWLDVATTEARLDWVWWGITGNLYFGTGLNQPILSAWWPKQHWTKDVELSMFQRRAQEPSCGYWETAHTVQNYLAYILYPSETLCLWMFLPMFQLHPITGSDRVTDAMLRITHGWQTRPCGRKKLSPAEPPMSAAPCLLPKFRTRLSKSQNQ